MDDLLLYKFLQNEASEDEIKTVLDWLDADPANRKYFDGLDNMLNAARVNRPAGRKPQRRPLPTLRSIGAWSMRSIGAWSMRIAAVLCLCLGVSYFAATKMFDRKASNNSLSVFVPNGERISMTLTDGTTVWLNSGTTLEYPAVFARAERRVKVTGEAMFDVKSDPQHPFVVETFACDVEVLGTKFDVTAEEREGLFSAALLRGSVKVTNRLTPGEQFVLKPNEEVRLAGRRLNLNAIGSMDDYLWTEGMISIKGLSFGELMHKFEKSFGVKIRIDRARMPEVDYNHGKIRISDGVDSALRLLQMASDFTYTRSEDNGTIVIR